MSEPSLPSHASVQESRLYEFLAGLPLFSGLPEATLVALASSAERIALPGGVALFDQDDLSDAFYVLRWGRLRAWRRDAEGKHRALGQIAPGECVGEVGLILERARNATAVALRDSELLRWSKASFEHLVGQHPGAMLRLAREALKRFAETIDRPAQARCFAVLATTPGVDAEAFAGKLADALRPLGQVRVVLPDEARTRGPGWFTRLEQQSGGLVYVGDDDPIWRERCVRQSDAVVLLADASQAPSGVLSPPPALSEHTPRHLVLLQPGIPDAGSTRPWIAALPAVTMHHHVRRDDDIARVARLLSGRATGLVLSGGGARGFAHIGALHALREAGIEVDYIAGCSAGAIVGAGIASDWDDAHLVAALRAAFVEDNPLSDRTLPLVAMHSGQKVTQVLKRTYGEGDIEDLPLPFFCVSTDLAEGVLHVHERGPLWIALRATSAIPGVVPPVFHERRVLVDGGIMDNLPVAEMRHRLAGEIIAVDVGGNYRIDTELEETALPPWWQQIALQWRDQRYPGIGRILWRAGMVNSAATVARQRRQSNLLLTPDLGEIDLLGWNQFERAVQLGYEETVRQLAASRR
ncbi:patatin-like phospholipase family protein [Xanthomonadaceae bacterium JHOS43]|nr:patatin-like phospholipase family protein [Xanthomonadaceae bacterium JHOS43]MCX7562116.1 patatin-like phospholipase family protein [Xanthomonadaceae bacterium XH05]